MSRLSNTQREKLFEAQESIERRDMVLLRGGSNGKTRIVYELQEAIARIGADGIVRTERRAEHPENVSIEFVPGITWRYNMTDVSIMKQVIAFAGEKPAHYAHLVRQRFISLLMEYRKRGKVLCIVIDNVEILSARDFSIIKGLNEMRDTKKCRAIGPAFLMAGQAGKLRALDNVLRHMTEITVGKITTAEISELLQEHYPMHYLNFDESALRKLAACEETLDVKRRARVAITKAKANRDRVITSRTLDLVESL